MSDPVKLQITLTFAKTKSPADYLIINTTLDELAFAHIPELLDAAKKLSDAVSRIQGVAP